MDDTDKKLFDLMIDITKTDIEVRSAMYNTIARMNVDLLNRLDELVKNSEEKDNVKNKH
jgi:hypothetical protein